MNPKKPTVDDQFERMPNWRQRLYIIIFEADTPAGKTFDIALLWAILLSVLAVMLESVSSIGVRYRDYLSYIEWFFTILFTLEYMARILAVSRPVKYIFSFLGIVDFLAIIPTYISIILIGGQYLLVIRTIRLLRVFRVFKLARFLGEAAVLTDALKASRHKILVFILGVLTLVVIMGTLMYVVEGAENGFTSIPISIYWAIVTLTTVGYGDISPGTTLGQMLASIIMIMGYGIIAVPTGIVTAELTKNPKNILKKTVCPVCQATDHQADAEFCRICGEKL